MTPPQRRGFGSRLIERSTSELDGAAQLEFDPAGLRYSIGVPLTASNSPIVLNVQPRHRRPIHALKGLRVIVVEDETLVAILLEDMLMELGCRSCGPPIASARRSIWWRSRPPTRPCWTSISPARRSIRSPKRWRIAISRSSSPPATARAGLIDAWRDRPIVQKPFQVEHLSDGLLAALGR